MNKIVDLNDLKQQISIVKRDIRKRFPKCSYTIKILLWDDNTSDVECRHGTRNRLYISRYRNGELTREAFKIRRGKNMMIDQYGNEYHRI